MNKSEKILPLGVLIRAYMRFHAATSLRAQILGLDPSLTPKALLRGSRWMNRSTLVDFYAMLMPILICVALCLLPYSSQSPWCAGALGFFALYRLNELLGSTLHVLIHRRSLDYVSERKLLLTLLLYGEPILLFAVLHGAVGIVCGYLSGGISSMYDFGGRPFNGVTLLHLSVGCYTSAGWGDIRIVGQPSMAMSAIESVVGVIMLALTVSSFISRAISSDGNVD